MSEERMRPDVLARIADDPQLARAVPLLPPEILHAAIAHCGLHDSGELLALATPEQLSAVLALDLWKAERGGADEQFDAARFCEWLAVIVDAGPAAAAARLAAMDVALVVAGLSPSIAVLDFAVFSPHGEPSGADTVPNAGRERGVHAEIGGYLVVARRMDGWDAIVEALLALDAHQPDTFHRVMQACRALSDSGREIDGLDDLLPEAAQARFDLSASREQRRERLGFLPPAQARAFLDAARRIPLTAEPPQADVVFAAYQRAMDVTSGTSPSGSTEPAAPSADEPSADVASAVASAIEVLRDAGVVGDPRRARLPAVPDEGSPDNEALNGYLGRSAELDEAAWMARQQELAFLANALVAGCSVQGRAFTRREAQDAVAATCNLGLELWPPSWPASWTRGPVTLFQVGWTVLHREVAIVAADRLVAALDDLRTTDRDLQFELYALRRDVHAKRQANTPWRARGRLDVLAGLDLPAWAALLALFDECPVMLANVSARDGRPVRSVNPTEFQFIAHARHIAAVHAFLLSLSELFAHG